MRTARWLVLGTVLAALATAGAQPSPAAMTGMADDIKTAATHAGYAEKYDSTKEVSSHLRHVLNCLVGPSDKRFDKAAGDPCQGHGNGILPDIKASMGEDQEYQVAWWLAQFAEQALKTGQSRPGKGGREHP
jgi:hypothetical protein